jgi:hypothetical protein
MATTVKQNPEKEVPQEVLAEAIKRVSEGMDRLLVSGLNFEAIVVLLHDATRLSKTDIRSVLRNLGDLNRMYGRK